VTTRKLLTHTLEKGTKRRMLKHPRVVHELPVIGNYTRFWSSEWALGSLYHFFYIVQFSDPLLILCCNFNFNPAQNKDTQKIMKQASHDGSSPLWPSSVLFNTTIVKIGNVP
jgi:hypothetical protein